MALFKVEMFATKTFYIEDNSEIDFSDRAMVVAEEVSFGRTNFLWKHTETRVSYVPSKEEDRIFTQSPEQIL